MFRDNRLCDGIPCRHSLQLDQKTFFEIPCRNADRIEGLDLFERSPNGFDRDTEVGGNVCHGNLQIPFLIEVSNDPDAYAVLLFRKVRELKLPVEVVRQRGSFHQEIFEGGPLLAVLTTPPADTA